MQGPLVEAGWPLTTGSRTPPTELTPLEFRVCSSGLRTQDLHYRDNLVQDFAESRISSYATEAYSDISRDEQAGRMPQEELVKQFVHRQLESVQPMKG